jgi:hypothetical protein
VRLHASSALQLRLFHAEFLKDESFRASGAGYFLLTFGPPMGVFVYEDKIK